MKYEITLKRVFSPGKICFEIPQDKSTRERLKALFLLCQNKYGDYVKCTFSPPYRPRTTGKQSQNSHIWGHIQQIAEETGNDISDVELYVKLRAIRRGYPFRVGKLTGEKIPYSFTEIDTEQAGFIIEELHQLASELSITLRED